MGGAEVRDNTRAVCAPDKGPWRARLKRFGGIKRRDTKFIQSHKSQEWEERGIIFSVILEKTKAKRD